VTDSATAEVTVSLPLALMTLFPEAERRLALSAASVAEIIDGLEARWPGMRDRLCDSRPAVRRHISIMVDGRRASLETRLRPGATVHILTAISGG
jgi:hypothetical protein